jgi:hypothetical protein
LEWIWHHIEASKIAVANFVSCPEKKKEKNYLLLWLSPSTSSYLQTGIQIDEHSSSWAISPEWRINTSVFYRYIFMCRDNFIILKRGSVFSGEDIKSKIGQVTEILVQLFKYVI